MGAKIVVVGSMNMDLVVTMERMPRPGETVRGQRIDYIPGGKGANQAVGCAQLGADVTMIGAVGDDAFGRVMRSGMEERGISVQSVKILPAVATGTASIFIAEEDNCIAVVPGANDQVSPEMVDRYEEVIAKSDVVVVQLEIPLATVERALAVAKQHGVTTVLNPAPASCLPASILAAADYITPNESEFDTLTGETSPDESSLLAAMQRWQSEYGGQVIVTRGKAGSSFVQDGRLHTSSAPKVDVVDTTGAGDCFNAALCYGLASGWALPKTVSFAVRAASLSVTRFGAQAGMPTLTEVEAAAQS